MALALAFRRTFTTAHRMLYRATGGTLGGTLHGAPILLLRTTGRRTGRRRETPLIYAQVGDRYVLVASNGGADQHPAWFLNLAADPLVEVQVARTRTPMRARRASAAERAALWPRMTHTYPGYTTYQERTRREIPVVLVEPLDSEPEAGGGPA